jgi:hypothetical protein
MSEIKPSKAEQHHMTQDSATDNNTQEVHPPQRGNDRYLPSERLAELRCGELWSGVDARRGGEVTLFYPKLKERITPRQLLQSLAPTFVQIAPLRDTAYCTIRDGDLDTQGALFLVIDRPEGQPLYTLLREHTTLDLDLALSLIIQLCELLKRAHDAQLFTANLTLHNLMVAPRPNGALQLSLVDLALDRRPLSEHVYPLPSELISPPHPSLTQERDRRHYAVYLCASLLHHLVFGVAPEAPISPGEVRVWPSLPQRGRPLDRRLEACLHTVLLKGLSVDPSARFPLISALQRTLIGLRQLSSISSPAFELLASTQARLGKSQGSLNLAAPRPGVMKAVEARQRIHKILEGEEASLENILEREGGALLR